MEKDLFKSRVRLRHLDCFVAVAQTRNLGRAAARLRLSQPAVSKTLNELEEILGVKLLERNRLGAQLTRDGDAFLAHAVAVLDALAAARSSVGADHVQPGDTVAVGALPTVAPDLLPPAIAAFRQRRAEVKVSVQTAANGVLLQMLRAGELDFALARMAEPDMMAGLSFELLYVEPLALVVRPGHPLAAAAVALDQVIAGPVIVSARGTIPRHNTESFLQSHGLRIPADCIETLSVSLARQIALQSDAVWFVPVGAVRPDLADGSLVRLNASTGGTEEPVGLLRRSEGAPTSTALAFMEVLRELAAARRNASGR